MWLSMISPHKKNPWNNHREENPKMILININVYYILTITIQNNVCSDPATIFKSSHLRQNYKETFPTDISVFLKKIKIKKKKKQNSKRSFSNISWHIICH